MSHIKNLLENVEFHIEAVNTDESIRFIADITASNPMEARINFIDKMRLEKALEPGADYTFDKILTGVETA